MNEVLSAQKMTNDKIGLEYTSGASIAKAGGKGAFIKHIDNDFMPFKVNGGKTSIKKTSDARMLVILQNKKPTPTMAKKHGAFFGNATTKRGEVNSLNFSQICHHCSVLGHSRLHCWKLHGSYAPHAHKAHSHWFPKFLHACQFYGVKGHIRPHCFKLNCYSYANAEPPSK